ncbi:hypothetical protein Tco_0517426 [Tanacetum coccineum]
MEDPNITMEDYIKIEEEKARRRGKVYNRETTTYGRIWYDDDCEPTVSSLNNSKIDFRISFDESDDEDYTPTVSYFDYLDFLKDFENEFPAIVYNDALTSKLDSSTKPIEIPHRIDEFDLKTKTSLSECDEEEQNVVYFNDLFPFNIIYLDDLESDKDNDNNKIDIIQSSDDMALPPKDQRHQYLRFEGLEYTDVDVAYFEMSWLGGAKRRMSWRQFNLALGLHTPEEMQTASFGLYWTESARKISNKGNLSAYWRGISSEGDFLGTPPSYTLIRDPLLRLCHRIIACSIAERSQAPEKDWVSSGHERQPDAAAGAPIDVGRAPDIDEGAQAVPAPEEVHEIRGTLGEQRKVMEAMARDLSRFTVWAARGISQLLDSVGATYVRYSEIHVPY